MANQDIRIYAKEKGIKLWQVAEAQGIAESTLTRWMRLEMSDETKADIIHIIDELADKVTNVQPVRHMWWITKADDYYKAWQNSGRSQDDMPYFVTGVKFACSNCFEQFDIDAKSVEKWNGCPICLARLDDDTTSGR